MSKLPVSAWTQAIMFGPNMPPRLPQELMRAMEPAAAGPERKVVGMVHHTPMEAWMPIADKQMRNRATPML